MSNNEKTIVPGGRVSKSEAWKYALGIFGQNLSCALMMNWFFVYCTDVLYIEGRTIGIVLGIARIWDAVNDPVMGTFIDRHTFKNGNKFRPFLKITPFIIGIIVVLLFTNWGFKGDMPKAIYVLILYLAYDMIFTIQDVSMWSMTSVMTDIPAEREKLSQYGRILAAIGFAVVGVFPTIMDILKGQGMSASTIYLGGAIVFGFGGMIISMLSASAQERITVTEDTKTESFGENLKMLFGNKIVMLVLLGNILNGMSLTVPAAYFFEHSVKATLFGKEVGGLTIMTIFMAIAYVFSGLGMFIVSKLSEKLGGMRNVLVWANVVTVLMRILGFFIGFEGNRIWITMILFAIGSIPGQMFGIARTALWGDSIDYMEWKTGKRAEAITFAAQTFCDKISTALNTVIAGFLLTWLEYDAEAIAAGAAVSEKFSKWIWPLFMIGPAIGAALYIIPLLFINYPKEMKDKVTRELRERRLKSGELAE
ncbi:MAG: MFS transporter [Erysipelotrichaceae bacterium]|nr:MFS transporter [Erysipelotrichaceae bacterium]